MTQAWSLVTFTSLPRTTAEPLIEQLEALGAMAISINPTDIDPIFAEPGMESAPEWQQAEVTAMFAGDVESADARMHAALGNAPAYRISTVADRDWANTWREQFPPLHIGGRLWVCTRDAEFDVGGLPAVRIDPGGAFGTGRHPTTALCLNALCELVGDQTQTLIDYGCGSGILAIAAALLGAPTVLAVDSDPAACAIAADNVRANGVADRIRILRPEELPEVHADLLVANILYRPLVELMPRFADLLSPGGSLLLSGLLAEQAADCLAAYQPLFNMQAPRFLNEWALLIGRRNDGADATAGARGFAQR